MPIKPCLYSHKIQACNKILELIYFSIFQELFVWHPRSTQHQRIQYLRLNILILQTKPKCYIDRLYILYTNTNYHYIVNTSSLWDFIWSKQWSGAERWLNKIQIMSSGGETLNTTYNLWNVLSNDIIFHAISIYFRFICNDWNL